jgi:hypothetical protein
MDIINFETLCNQGSAKYNEDILGFTPNGMWVLDGATGLNRKNLVSNQSDAKWYVTWWNKYLYENISKNKSLKEILKDGIRKINIDYKNILKENITNLDKPSSSICVVKFYEDKLEYLILGDCALHLKINNKTSIIKDIKICNLDNKVYEEMENLPNLYNLNYNQIRNSVMDTIINNRLKKNTKDGYWILEFEEEAIDYAINDTLKIDTDMSIMITSDGYSCISDRYKFIEENELIDEVKKNGIREIYLKLREIEDEEFSINKFPRFKENDDSSCIYADIKV